MEYELNTDIHTSGYIGLLLKILFKVIATTIIFIIGHVALVYVLAIAMGIFAVMAATSSAFSGPYYVRRRSSPLADAAIIGSGAYVGYKLGKRRKAKYSPPRK